MSNTTAVAMSAEDMRDATTIVFQVSGRMNGGDLDGAYRLARSGQKLYPGMTVDGVDGEVWSVVMARLAAQLGDAVPVSAVPVSAAPVSARPVSAAPVSARPVSAAPVAPDSTLEPGPGSAIFGTGHGTIVFEHSVEYGTIMSGSVKHDGFREIIGSGPDGQHWAWHRTGKYFYLAKSAGFSADMERINWAALAARRGGWHAVNVINNRAEGATHDAPAKKDSQYRQTRLFQVRMAARRQQWVDSAQLLAAAPVSAVPVSARPVSAAPVSVAPVSVAPVSTPRPPVSVAPVITVPDYATMGNDALLDAAWAGELGARAEVRARLDGTTTPAVAPVSAAPAAPETDAAMARLLKDFTAEPVQEPEVALPPQVRITGDTAEVWYDVAVTGKLMKEAATGLRVSLNRAVANKFGENGNRPLISVYRSKAAKAFRVTVKAHDGGSVYPLIVNALNVAATANGVTGMREFIEISASETVDA